MIKKFFYYYGCRNFSKTKIWRNIEKAKPPEPDTSYERGPTNMNFKPSEYEKKILVWSGQFKSADAIPSRIGFETLERAKSRLRIRLSNLMILGALCLCGYYVWLGKKRVREGQSLLKIQLEKSKKILEENQKPSS